MNNTMLLIGMLLVTYIPRMLPFALASKLNLPARVENALAYVPIAVLTVIVVQTSLFEQRELNLAFDNVYMWASIASFICALLKKGLFTTIAAGLTTFFVFKFMVFPI